MTTRSVKKKLLKKVVTYSHSNLKSDTLTAGALAISGLYHSKRITKRLEKLHRSKIFMVPILVPRRQQTKQHTNAQILTDQNKRVTICGHYVYTALK